MKVCAVIPARYESSRFPGKPLVKILEKSMIQWVYERTARCPEIQKTVVATDDKRIFEEVQSFKGKAVMTSPHHKSGTDRIAEAIEVLQVDADIVLNVQGDEPVLKTTMLENLIEAFQDPTVQMATFKKEIFTREEIQDSTIVKVVTDTKGNAIYFSRSPLPFNRDGIPVKYFKHIGIYGYRREFLLQYTSWPQTPLELAEQLEQLRVIENGFNIRVIETKYQSLGVDLPEHIPLVEQILLEEGIEA